LRGYNDSAVSEIAKHVFCGCKLELARRVSANTKVCCSIATMIGFVGNSDIEDFCASVSYSIPCALNASGKGELCQATALNHQTSYTQEHYERRHDSPVPSDALDLLINCALVQVRVFANTTLMYRIPRAYFINA
jgi:hypothetical protein